MADLAQAAPRGLDLLPLVGVGDDDDRGVGIVDDVADLFGDEGRIDRDRQGAPAEGREIGDDPVGPVLRKDDHLVAGPEPELAKAEGEVPDPVAEFLRRQRDVGPVLFGEHEIGLGIGFQRVQKDLGEGFDHSVLLAQIGPIVLTARETCQDN